MRRHRPQIVSLLFGLMLTSAALGQQPGVNWQTDLEAAKNQARQTGKLVLVHVWTPECMPCLALEQNVFNQPGVGAQLELAYVPVKMNANENRATAEQLGITRVPTDVIITPDGQIVGRLISPPTPGGYVAEVTKVAREYGARAGQPKPGESLVSVSPNAAAAAPPINTAYAALNVSPQTQPAVQTAPINTMPAPVAAAPVAGPPRVAATPVAMQNQFTQQNPLPALVGTQPVTSAAQAPPTSFAQPAVSVSQPAAPSFAAPTTQNFAPPAAPVTPATQTASYPATPPVASYRTAQQPTIPALAPITPVAPNEVAMPQLQSPTANTAVPATVAVGGATATAATTAGAPDAKLLPAGAPPLGFDGYCPVSMRSHWKWVPGNPQFGIVHRGRTYWFAGQAEQEQFWTDPDRFAPALSGMDPVLAVDHRQQVPGKREHSIDYDNLFYMFSSEATLQQFTANPERYAVSVRQAMGIPRGRLVR